jgi:hypothetical protein
VTYILHTTYQHACGVLPWSIVACMPAFCCGVLPVLHALPADSGCSFGWELPIYTTVPGGENHCCLGGRWEVFFCLLGGCVGGCMSLCLPSVPFSFLPTTWEFLPSTSLMSPLLPGRHGLPHGDSHMPAHSGRPCVVLAGTWCHCSLYLECLWEVEGGSLFLLYSVLPSTMDVPLSFGIMPLSAPSG